VRPAHRFPQSTSHHPRQIRTPRCALVVHIASLLLRQLGELLPSRGLRLGDAEVG
jgi:hypothetical protein